MNGWDTLTAHAEGVRHVCCPGLPGSAVTPTRAPLSKFPELFLGWVTLSCLAHQKAP